MRYERQHEVRLGRLSDQENAMRVLVVEDDPMIGESLEECLRKEQYAVDWVRDGRAAELALSDHDYDIVLLDLGLPHKQGLAVLEDYRRRQGDASVLIMTARDATAERVQGLDAGADDYLVKPFDLDELLARMRALVRRRAGRVNPEIRYRELTMNPATHQTTYKGAPLHLSAREFALLLALIDPPGRVMSRSQLEERLYGWNEEIESNTVEVYVHGLRKKLGAEFIRNVRGVGYMVGAGS
jgi:DNA-binding response OmpR family regulator